MDGESLLHTTRKRMSVKTKGGSPREQEKKTRAPESPPLGPACRAKEGGREGEGVD